MSWSKLPFWFSVTSAALLGLSACQDKTAAPDAETPAVTESPATVSEMPAVSESPTTESETSVSPESPPAAAKRSASNIAVQTVKPIIAEPEIDLAAQRAAQRVAQFQANCRERITAKMIDPDAASITYVPTSQPDAYLAQVELLNRATGGTIRLDFDCRRNADGEVTTKMLAD